MPEPCIWASKLGDRRGEQCQRKARNTKSPPFRIDSAPRPASNAARASSTRLQAACVPSDEQRGSPLQLSHCALRTVGEEAPPTLGPWLDRIQRSEEAPLDPALRHPRATASGILPTLHPLWPSQIRVCPLPLGLVPRIRLGMAKRQQMNSFFLGASWTAPAAMGIGLGAKVAVLTSGMHGSIAGAVDTSQVPWGADRDRTRRVSSCETQASTVISSRTSTSSCPSATSDTGILHLPEEVPGNVGASRLLQVGQSPAQSLAFPAGQRRLPALAAQAVDGGGFGGFFSGGRG
ncbi:uncharacterized protein PAN0_004d2328 [Moesziomyces antarcticus]|uniref:Uncharacterized protein n=1 Tax=Pseudozyma antarctica TaxID=84753 RepID=A0A081CBS3_PSEA2|nr:uncharacterized protein PAN0_004d2328 [Moesziomyces antarcticus]GAK64119.1 hypothetical protein PAN0_004d2328 [Moesziomyces antarcticus]